MTAYPLATLFLILAIVFFIIAVVGDAKVLFIEINPGLFGRILALFLGIFSLATAGLLVVFPGESLDLIRNYLANFLQKYAILISQS
jgi:hypothetical protein